MIMGDVGYITDNTPSRGDFRFTEVLEDARPYKMIGYVEGVCPDANNPYGYTPPYGWMITSCTWMPPGSHGVPVGQPAVLITCEPIKNNIPPLEPWEPIISILYPSPSDLVEDQPKLDLITALAMGGAGLALLGGYIWYNSRRR